MTRTLMLPIEGAGALRTIIGILTDHDVPVDLDRMAALDQRVEMPWTDQEWTALNGPERGIPLSIEDAALLLNGLEFTEVMSVEFPWFEQLVWVVEFVKEHLMALWTQQEWEAHWQS